MKPLKEILYRAGIREMSGSPDTICSGIAGNSSRVKQGDVFVAIKGTRVDGHDFISEAISQGASVIVAEHLPEGLTREVCTVIVADTAYALGQMASNFYDQPSSQLKLVGVTGTNGKTTIATLLYKLFSGLGYKTALLSTVCNRIGDEIYDATHTTPDPVELNAFLALAVEKGCTHCFMEVSSHAVVQQRISGLEFIGGIFTNLTHDHLDYHKTFENYRDAKKLFFDRLPASAFALTNVDDRNGEFMIQNTRARRTGYSMTTLADHRAQILESRFAGLLLNIDGAEVWFRLIGKFNAYNILAIYGAALLMDEDKHEVLRVLSGLEAVEGRFDYFVSPNRIMGIVDYAHTPDALQNVLSTVTALREGNEKIITVVGAGGNRDAAKRPVMARIACTLSDRVILTSDNPRFEDPETILNEMQAGVDVTQKKKVLRITSREEAIHTACELAMQGDIIVVAGKGHEKYQEINGVKSHFDDKEILKKYLL
jgi:UDP-N-acetylmuramoyl-L-alanyl-D-glutamate--2,6-diaminopimelate ligase